MRIIFENNHTPAIGKYCDAYVQDLLANVYYVYDDQGTYYRVPGSNYLGAFAVAPLTAPEGSMYYNTTNSFLYVRDATRWVNTQVPPGSINLVDSSGQIWQLSVTTLGELVTTILIPSAGYGAKYGTAIYA